MLNVFRLTWVSVIRPNEFGRAYFYVLGELHSPKTEKTAKN
jgi:hypothetical protein